jgi:hypothetical protein
MIGGNVTADLSALGLTDIALIMRRDSSARRFA